MGVLELQGSGDIRQSGIIREGADDRQELWARQAKTEFLRDVIPIDQPIEGLADGAAANGFSLPFFKTGPDGLIVSSQVLP